ncbi:beta-lactamase-like protein [Boeremia exigua]|uniref:beta-lactamase-like protein n=1 Tax=Boeremia exigua TaxID=749465 RepID=UPI001E8CA170|nr:beta-lactamase-like protein [Boeremia exigua]KAH6643090.1 beta-lactamase-like protein [Boeremia exigua]
MSTFKGIVAEFPQIRLDYFRHQPEHKAPLACFLSHVHSDHLAGLDSLRAPFVYCSAATREILLRLEKFHYRVNFAKGILESRNVTYDRSMRKLAKPLPLDTPTTIELAPGNSIRVTLIDANHCVGAVMFLIEGNGKAVLYTGDIRAEAWWVNSIVQNPVLAPYALGLRSLDCIYLDTTFATKHAPYKTFPSKAEGIRELLEQVSSYPQDTIFYFHAWTFGYENVWYRTRIYGSLSSLDRRSLREAGLDVQSENKFLREAGIEIREAAALCGFRNGNHVQPGCLTSSENARIHSCERGMGCSVMDKDADKNIVHIIPIVTRANGIEIAELGAGGGKGDLDQKEELETGDVAAIGRLMELCVQSIDNPDLSSKVLALLQHALNTGEASMDFGLQLQRETQASEDDLSLQNFVAALASRASKTHDDSKGTHRTKTIRFPYSRHSSYSELCELVAAFNPRDVFPCTVDESTWTPGFSSRALFGEHCSAQIFRHDAEMLRIFQKRQPLAGSQKRDQDESQQNTQFETAPEITISNITKPGVAELNAEQVVKEPKAEEEQMMADVAKSTTKDFSEQRSALDPMPGLSAEQPPAEPPVKEGLAFAASTPRPYITSSKNRTWPERKRKSTNAQLAYDAAIGTHLTWADFGGLVSTGSNAVRQEDIL